MPLPTEILESLPEDLRADETLNRFNSIEDLAKSYKELNSFRGSSIRIPGEDAGEEARTEFINKLINNAPELMFKPDFSNPEQADEFFQTLGVPDDFSKYENPEGIELDAEVEAELRQVLHDARLTPKQYQTVIDQLSARNKEAIETQTSLKEQDQTRLKAKWGNALEERMEAAKKVNDEFFEGRPFENLSSAEIEGLFQIHKSVTQESLQAAGQPTPKTMTLTPEEANTQAEEIIKRVTGNYDLSHAERTKLMQKVVDLKKQAGFAPELPRAGL